MQGESSHYIFNVQFWNEWNTTKDNMRQQLYKEILYEDRGGGDLACVELRDVINIVCGLVWDLLFKVKISHLFVLGITTDLYAMVSDQSHYRLSLIAFD